MPPLPAQDQGSGCRAPGGATGGTGCPGGDAPEAASKLASFLGLSGPDLEALTSCQDFARMGLLGVPFCSNLPRVLKCLCPSAQLCSQPSLRWLHVRLQLQRDLRLRGSTSRGTAASEPQRLDLYLGGGDQFLLIPCATTAGDDLPRTQTSNEIE